MIKRRNTRFELIQSGFSKALNVPFLSGCFMFFRMSAIEDVGMFDEHFFLYAEDVDITRRMHQKYETIFYPDTTIYHTFTRGSRRSLRLLFIQIINIMRYLNKWGWWRDEERDEVNREVLNKIGGEL